MTMTMDDDGAILVHLTNPGGIVGGTGVANQITYWIDTDTIGGDPGLTYNAATDTLSLANSLTFTGATGVNDVTVPDNLADALSLDDVGGLTYLQVVSANTQPVVRWNPASVDVDFHVSATGMANALFVRGSDGAIGMGTTAPERSLHVERSIYAALHLDTLDSDSESFVDLWVGGAKTGTWEAFGSVFPGVSRRNALAFTSQVSLLGTMQFITKVGASYLTRLFIANNGYLGVGTEAPTAKIHIDQASATAAAPVMKLDQGDIGEPFVDFIGTSAASAANSLSSWTTGNAVQGHIQIDVNGTKRWLRFYDDPTS